MKRGEFLKNLTLALVAIPVLKEATFISDTKKKEVLSDTSEFYRDFKKVKLIRVTNELLQDTDFLEHEINHCVKGQKIKSWEIGFQHDDFSQDSATIKIILA